MTKDIFQDEFTISEFIDFFLPGEGEKIFRAMRHIGLWHHGSTLDDEFDNTLGAALDTNKNKLVFAVGADGKLCRVAAVTRTPAADLHNARFRLAYAENAETVETTVNGRKDWKTSVTRRFYPPAKNTRLGRMATRMKHGKGEIDYLTPSRIDTIVSASQFVLRGIEAGKGVGVNPVRDALALHTVASGHIPLSSPARTQAKRLARLRRPGRKGPE